MSSARIPKTSRRKGPGREKGDKGVAWDQNPDIMSRLEEHQRLRDAGMTPRQIITMQQIETSTYYEDEKRLKELAARLLGRSYLATFQAMVQEAQSALRDSHRLYEDPGADYSAKAQAVKRRIEAVHEISSLYRFYQAGSNHPVAPETALPTESGGPMVVQQNNVIVTNPNEMLEILERRAAELYSEMNAIPGMVVDDARKIYGYDNIIPVGQRIKSGVEEEGDDDDDEE